MNEGKPTKPSKAKWWSRPRPQVPEAGDPVRGDSEGDFELARPAAAADGDFELEAPSPGPDGQGAGPVVGDTGAVAEAAEPLAPGGSVPVPGGSVPVPDGSVPVSGGFVPVPDGSVPVSGGSVPVPGGSVPVSDGSVPVSGAAAPMTGTAGPSPGTPVVPSATDRPKPLHDPDPYSTPPYGEPGPWAPAPPVQHPATTPAHGTATQAPAQPPSPASPTPAPGAPLSPPATQAPGAPLPPPVTSAPGAPLSPPATPAPGTPLPPPVTPVDVPQPDPWRRYDPWFNPAFTQTPLQAHGPLQQNGAAVPTEQQRRRRAGRALVGGALALALVSGGVGGAVGAYLERNGGVGAVQLPQAGKVPAGRAPDSVAGIAARALPSVVTLHVSGSDEQDTGTGFLLDTRGHILTNNHVVEPAASSGEISVTFSSGDTAKARIVGRDSGYDLAVVQVKGVRGLTPLPLGNSDNVQVGDPVVAIGAPFDLANTVTSGIISAKERPITAGGESEDGSDVSYVDALQTDAPINPGNSGGPLLDSQARVVGINSAIRSADSGSELQDGQAGSIGLGFAIPVNQAKRVAEELINEGRAAHPVIGVTLDMSYTGDGARIGSKGAKGSPAVTTGGPGDRAGLRPGDVITEVDGQRVHSGEELIVKTRAHRPGDRLRLTLERDGEEKSVSLVLGSSDDN
ncbi:trypsin-like peptidase domain-containing protein [Streptomyces sp. NPDC086549]|uniref:S1C family serine protease n=1 Tax=Streptomyces sp. NPDC086549 TaxID=3365752 RepID=UPI0037FCF79F